MLFFEPGAYEDFIFRLSALKIKPPADSWERIGNELQIQKQVRREKTLGKILAAATVLTLLGLGTLTVLLSRSSTFQTTNGLAQTQIDPGRLLPKINLQQKSASLEIENTRTKLQTLKEKTETIVTENNEEKVPTLHSLLPKAAIVEKEGNINFASFATHKKQSKKVGIPNPEKQSSTGKNWSVSLAFAPSYSYHTAGFTEFNYYSNERGAWLWSGEILAKRKISRRFSIFTGVSVSPVGQNINDILLLSNSKENKQMEHLVANTTYGWVSLDNQVFAVINSYNISNTPNTILKSSAVNKVQLSQQLHYLEIPFILSYSLYANQTHFDFKAGFATGVLISNRFIIKGISKRIVGETEGVNTYNSTAIASVCFSAPISRNVRLNIEPTVKFGMQPLKYDNEVTYPFSTSVKFGVNYSF